MTKLDRAREWLANGLIAAGRKLAGWTCPHLYVQRALAVGPKTGHLIDIIFVCDLCKANTTDPPFMALRAAWARRLDWYEKRRTN